jgi:hypothetical protein
MGTYEVSLADGGLYGADGLTADERAPASGSGGSGPTRPTPQTAWTCGTRRGRPFTLSVNADGRVSPWNPGCFRLPADSPFPAPPPAWSGRPTLTPAARVS